MKVISLNWLGVRTENAAAMVSFYQDVLGLEVLSQQSSGTRFRLGDGSEVHVYSGEDKFHCFFGTSPVIGFRVDSFAEVHGAMAQAGVEFIYPEPQRQAGQAWQHFRAPDGNVYEIIGPDDLNDAPLPKQ